jgi:hypothetical protein
MTPSGHAIQSENAEPTITDFGYLRGIGIQGESVVNGFHVSLCVLVVRELDNHFVSFLSSVPFDIIIIP